MFALVKFSDESNAICPMKNITVRDATTCIVKYSGCKYEAELLATNETREHLQLLKDSFNRVTLSANSSKQKLLPYQKPKIIKVEKLPPLNLKKYIKKQSCSASKFKNQLPVIEPSVFNNSVVKLNKHEVGKHSSLSDAIDGSIICDVANIAIAETDETTSTVDDQNNTYTLTRSRATGGNSSHSLTIDESETMVSDKNDIPQNNYCKIDETHSVEFNDYQTDVTYNVNLSDLVVLPLEQSTLENSDVNSSHYLFQTLLHNPNILFPSADILTSTPETGLKAENDNITDVTKNTSIDIGTQPASTEPPCLPDSDGYESNDPEYEPQQDNTSDSASEAESFLDNAHSRKHIRILPNNDHNVTCGLSVSNATNLPGSTRCNDEDLQVTESQGRNGDRKQNFCFYCHTKQQKIARHLELKHCHEPDVKKFTDLPKNSIERRKIIAVIRKKGNFLFNTQSEYNDGELIVSRRPNAKFDRMAKDFRACANCKAFFSKHSLRVHFAKCAGRSSKKTRIVTVMSKQVMARLHPRASDVVTKQIFPPLREDDVVRAIRYDELVIVYANKMGEKYQYARDYEMVRQRIRLLGRFLITIRTLNNDITDLTSVYDPKFCDDAVKAITIEAKLTQTSRRFATPAVASSLGTLLKLLGSILVNECIKKHDDTKKKDTKDFIKLLTQELALSINRKVVESQTQQKRCKKVELPSMEDVKKLCTYLEDKRNAAFEELRCDFSEKAWIKLAEATLTSLQLFNRRRAGEIERTLIEDFQNYQSLDENTDKHLFNSLSKESQALAKKYVRFVIRGKLNRTVPVLLNTQLLQCIELLLSFRKHMKICSKNPYIFGLPSGLKSKFKHLRACALLRRFSSESGATHPERLRGTKLRKHIATVCVSLNLSENQVTDLANYMGHAEKIHKDIYRQPLLNREILGMSKLLEVAQGANEEMDDEDDTDDEAEPIENYNDVGSSQTDDFETTKDRDVHIRPPSNKNQPGSLAKKLRFSSPYGVRRTRWNDAEKEKVLELFGTDLKINKFPSLKVIHNAIIENPCLKNRTSPQIKTWLHNQTRPKKKNKVVKRRIILR